MTRPMQRLGAACGIVFPIAMFLAVGNGSHFTPWRAVAATWALVLALPFLAYLWSLLRVAEGDGGWLSTLALVAGVSGVLLKLASHAPELAIHRDGIAKGTQLYKALDNTAGAATLMESLPARSLLRSRRRDRAARTRPASLARHLHGSDRCRARRQRRLRLRELRASVPALPALDAPHEHRPAPPHPEHTTTNRIRDVRRTFARTFAHLR